MAETRGSVRQRKGKTADKSSDSVFDGAGDTDASSAADADEELQERDAESEGKEHDEDMRATSEQVKTRRTRANADEDEDDPYSPWVDILRVISFLVFASCALSYLVSGGESYVWNMKAPPKYFRLEWWKNTLKGPVYFIPEELALYNGTDPDLPIYLGINGSIYDVTVGRRIYGPGGSYHNFAGVDASRGYVTGCFATDRTADLRGAEDMFLPNDDEPENKEIDAMYSSADLDKLRKKEYEAARKRVKDAVDHWAKFFAKSPKYRFVGYLKREKNWLEKQPVPTLCAAAEKGRPKREKPETGG